MQLSRETTAATQANRGGAARGGRRSESGWQSATGAAERGPFPGLGHVVQSGYSAGVRGEGRERDQVGMGGINTSLTEITNGSGLVAAPNCDGAQRRHALVAQLSSSLCAHYCPSTREARQRWPRTCRVVPRVSAPRATSHRRPVRPSSLLPQLTHRNAATDSAFNATENTPAAHTLTGSMIS